MAPEKSTLLFIVILASLLSAASFAGGHRKLMSKSALPVGDVSKDSSRKLLQDEEAFVAHPRILSVKTNDYGRYDPAPAFVKPRYKLIPN